MANNFQYDDKAFTSALKQYLDIKTNLDPAQEVRRRAKNIGMRLIRLYGQSAPTVADITAKIRSLNGRVKVRPKIKAMTGKKGKALSRKRQINIELKARIQARKLSATGWFPAVTILGGNPKSKLPGKRPHGQARGRLKEALGGFNPTETLYNDQEGAAQTDARGGGAVEKALTEETADIVKYVDRKNLEAAQKAGL